MNYSQTNFKLKILNFNPQTPNELKIKIHVNFIRLDSKPKVLRRHGLRGAVFARQNIDAKKRKALEIYRAAVIEGRKSAVLEAV